MRGFKLTEEGKKLIQNAIEERTQGYWTAVAEGLSLLVDYPDEEYFTYEPECIENKDISPLFIKKLIKMGFIEPSPIAEIERYLEVQDYIKRKKWGRMGL